MMSSRKVILQAVGQKIRELRLHRGYTQESFAAKANLDRAYYGGIERGERNVSTINLVRVAVALEVEVRKLFPDISKFTTNENCN